MNSNPYKWAQTTVLQILRRQEYCGDVINEKTYSRSFKDKRRFVNPPGERLVTRNVHIPIIERDMWELIQQKLAAQKVRRKQGEASLFSGFLRCGDCNCNLHYHFNQNNPSIEYYNCSNYAGNHGACSDTHYVRLDFLEHEVQKVINQLLRHAHKDLAEFERRTGQCANSAMMRRQEDLHRSFIY